MSIFRLGLPAAVVSTTLLFLPGCGNEKSKEQPEIVLKENDNLDKLKGDPERQSLFNFGNQITINPKVASKVADDMYMIDFTNKFNARARELEQRFQDVSKLPIKYQKLPKQFNNLESLRELGSLKVDLEDKELLKDLDVVNPEVLIHDPAFFDSLNLMAKDEKLPKVIQMVPTTSSLEARTSYPHAITIGRNAKFKPDTLSLRFYIDSVTPESDEVKLGLSFQVGVKGKSLEVVVSPNNLPFTIIDENDEVNLLGKAMYIIGSKN